MCKKKIEVIVRLHELGVPMVLLNPETKKPFGNRSVDQSRDLGALLDRFASDTNALIGIRAGKASSIAFLEFKNSNGAFLWREDHWDRLGYPPITTTRDRRTQFWFQHYRRLRSKPIAPDIEIVASSFIIVEEVETLSRFTSPLEASLPAWPSWLRPGARPPSAPVTLPAIAGLHSLPPARAARKAKNALKYACDEIEQTGDGRRSKNLYERASHIARYVRVLCLPRDLAFERLTAAGRKAGLNPIEAFRAVERALRHQGVPDGSM